MNKIIGAGVGFILLIGVGCQSKTDGHKQPEDAQATVVSPVAELEKAVLATHDSAMADMSELMRLEKEVKLQLTNVATQAPSTEPGQRQEQGLAVSNALSKADAAMMDWMHEYNGDTLAKLDQQQAMQYLKDQQQKVNVMRQLMLESMRNAKAYLK